MRRDWRLIRTILIASENNTYNNRLTLEDFPEENPQEVSYNTALLLSAGLINCVMSKEKSDDPTDFWLFSPTWQGHELLSSIQDDNTWAKLTNVIKTKGGALTFDVLKSIGISITQPVINSLIA